MSNAKKEKRYESGATIVTSSLVFSQWSGIFANDKVVTTAILDRLLHHSHVINILGDSYTTTTTPL